MRAFRLILICFLLTNIASAQQLITFTAIAKYTTMGLEDQIDITYACEGDSVSNFHAPAFAQFEIVEGPRTAQSRRTTYENGIETEKKSLTVYYALKPVDTGSLTIEPGTIVLTNGSKILSNSLKIKVLPGSIANTLNGGNHETRKEKSRDLHIALLMSNLPYVVCAGPVYVYDTSAIDNILSVINDSLRPLLKKDPANKEHGVYWDHDIPRLQVAVKDTTGLRDAIEAKYPKDGKAIYLTTITQPAAMMFTMENAFDQKYFYYSNFANLKKTLAESGADTISDRRILTTWTFHNAKDRKQFKKTVKKQYHIEKEDDFTPKGPYSVTFRMLTLSRVVKMNDEAVVRKLAEQLMGFSEACNGVLRNLSIARDTN